MNRRGFFKFLLLIVTTSVATVGCINSDDTTESFDYAAQYELDQDIIEAYIIDNGLDNAYNIQIDGVETGVYINFTEEGTEDTDIFPTRDDSESVTTQYVTVGYKGYLVDGTVFDETSEGETATFALSNLIVGWQVGIPEMSKGDVATIMIPSLYGYQNYAAGSVPANSVLIFDISLDSFERF